MIEFVIIGLMACAACVGVAGIAALMMFAWSIACGRFTFTPREKADDYDYS